MLHILFLPSWYPNHPADVKGVFFRDQALALAEYGHTVGVVAPGMRSLRTVGRRDNAGIPPSFECDNGVPTYRDQIWAALPRIPYGNYWLWKRAARKLLEAYVRNQGMPDVIHAHAAIYAGLVAAEWANERGVPMILTEHSSGFARHVYKPWQLRLANRAASGADACVTVSPALGELLGKELPKSNGRWEWIPNVVARRFSYCDQERNSQRERPMRFLNLALMTENKGQQELIEAFADAYSGKPGTAELWMAGYGPLRGTLEQLAQKLDIDKQVQFLGQIPPDDVPALLQQVDVMVIASHYETFGVVAAEALMSGIPVIATRCGGPECIVGEADGLLVPPRDPTAMANALREIVARLPTMANQDISKRAEQRFSGAAVAEQLTALYERVSVQKKAVMVGI